MNIEKSTYHHGNLKSALVQAGIEILQEDGLQAVGLRAVARRANVSQAAPYYHFKSKTDLLCEISAIGYTELTQTFIVAQEKFKDFDDFLIKVSIEYIKFSQENPNLYNLMRRKEIPYDDWTDSLKKNFEVVLKELKKCSKIYLEKAKSNHDLNSFALAWGVMLIGTSSSLLDDRLKIASTEMDPSCSPPKEDIETLVTKIFSVLAPTP